jgi:mannose-6-phosphate isomerase-like protein (cupin superfamily)
MTPPHSSSPAMKLISTETAEHYTWGDGCDGWFFLKSDGFHVIQEKMPPHSSEVMHYHRNSRQLFYVLRGELTMYTVTGLLVIPAGHAVSIEPSVAHQARNDSNEVIEFLTISCPPSHRDRFNCA